MSQNGLLCFFFQNGLLNHDHGTYFLVKQLFYSIPRLIGSRLGKCSYDQCGSFRSLVGGWDVQNGLPHMHEAPSFIPSILEMAWLTPLFPALR